MSLESTPTGAPKEQKKKPADIFKEKLEGLSEQEKSFAKAIRAFDAISDLAESKIKDSDPQLYGDLSKELDGLFNSLHDVYKNPQAPKRKSSLDLEYIGHDLNKEIGSIGEAIRKARENK